MFYQILYIALAALGLGFLIFIHELAHYWMAKKVGMKVEAFSIGFGRSIFSWKRKDEIWKIGWLPFGGYVKIAGMQKEGKLEPHEIKDGYFSKKPWDRIKVVGIAPVVNLICAFLFFTLIWAMGGREKPFHDFTNRIGYIDPQSEIYAAGIRPGDSIISFNGQKFHSFKDLFQATMLSKNGVQFKGYQYNFLEGTRQPFDLEVTAYQHPEIVEKGILTSGILSPANYLIYNRLSKNQPNPLLKGSALYDSGIEYGDRVVWMDGELIFSTPQLNALLNSEFSLLTIQRKNETYLAKIPRFKVSEFKLSEAFKAELGDWKYAGHLKPNLKDLFIIPYQISASSVVESPIRFLERESFDKSQEPNSATTVLNTLKVGDKIIAIDGQSVSSGPELFMKMQAHQFNIITQSGNQNLPILDWQEADSTFDQSLHWGNLVALTNSIGTPDQLKQVGQFKLLKPVVPATMEEIALKSGMDAWLKQIEEQKEKIAEINSPERRALAMKLFEQGQKRLFLGVSFQDRVVRYNPPPYVMFGRVTADISNTLGALVTGQLNPKWLSGPVGIVQIVHHGWSLGFKEALFWLALISLNLGFLNLLPIPMLDGGHICFALWELFTRKPLKYKVMERITVPFMVLLIGFFVFVTFHDLSRIFKGFF